MQKNQSANFQGFEKVMHQVIVITSIVPQTINGVWCTVKELILSDIHIKHGFESKAKQCIKHVAQSLTLDAQRFHPLELFKFQDFL